MPSTINAVCVVTGLVSIKTLQPDHDAVQDDGRSGAEFIDPRPQLTETIRAGTAQGDHQHLGLADIAGRADGAVELRQVFDRVGGRLGCRAVDGMVGVGGVSGVGAEQFFDEFGAAGETSIG